MTLASDYTFNDAKRLVGRHAIIRDDPMFGRRGLIAEVIVDESHGFVVLVKIFRKKRYARDPWEEPMFPTPDMRRYWPPGRVEIVA